MMKAMMSTEELKRSCNVVVNVDLSLKMEKVRPLRERRFGALSAQISFDGLLVTHPRHPKNDKADTV